MTQEEISKIWIDLSARVMYHPNIQVTNTHLNQTQDDVLTMANFTQFSNVKYEVKPYLRPLSTMTEEEKEEYSKVIETLLWTNELDFYNSHHFDYRELIDLGLALEASEDMYNF